MTSREATTRAVSGAFTAINGEPDLLAVERALSELRRGRAVVVRGAGPAMLVHSVEALTDDALARLRATGVPPLALAVSAQRARSLGRSASGTAVVAVPVNMALEVLRELAGIGAPDRESVHEPLAVLPCTDALEAAVALARHARLVPAVVAVAMDPALPDPTLLEVGAAQIDRFRAGGGRQLERVIRARVPLREEEQCELVLYRDTSADREHLAILIGKLTPGAAVPVRVHSACLTGDVLASLRCDCGDQLRGAVRNMSERGGGVLLYLDQEGRGIGLANKLRAYALQDTGLDTFDADEHLGFGPDERSFAEAAVMLRDLGIRRIRLLTNNPHKVDVLLREGIEVEAREPIIGARNAHNHRYLDAKVLRAGHVVDDDAG